MQDGILSIQSAVAYGHVGNSAAVFPLQRLGFEVWPVNTVLFSNHTGYGAWRGRVVGPRLGRGDHRGDRRAWRHPARRAPCCPAIWATPSLGEAVLRAVARVRAARPDMLYACDPVMGDEGRGFFVRPGIPEFFRDQAVPAADIVTPNQFELAWLAGREIAGLEDALAAAAAGSRHRSARSSSAPAWTSAATDELGILAHSARGQLAVPHAPAAGHPQRHRRRLHRPVPGLLAEDGRPRRHA